MKAGPISMFVLGFWSLHAIGFADPVDAPQPAHGDLDSQIGFILANPLEESDYSKSNRCVLPNNYESVEVLDSRHLLFWGRRGAVWLNQLRFECPGLDDHSVLVFEMRDRSLCQMDSFRSVSRAGGPSNVGMNCMLGHFESITEAQAVVLRDALMRRARSTLPESTADDDE